VEATSPAPGPRLRLRRARFGLEGRTAVITGAGRGIGRATAEALSKRGVRVVLVDRNGSAAREAQLAIESHGGQALALEADVCHRASWRDILERTLARFGDAHILVNNAGVLRVGPALAATDEAWDEVIGVNLWGVVHGCRTFGPHFQRKGVGHIVNVASAAGLSGLPYAASYATSKFAVVGLSESLRWELSEQGVGVTVVCPGAVRTGIAEGSGGPRTAELVDRYGLRAEPLARRIVQAIEHDRARVLYGLEPRLWTTLRWLGYGLHDRAGKALAHLRSSKGLF
jgi:NAD(P)-dependent dehydrogenase (short-subunit alcohol dehydrogenase family)